MAELVVGVNEGSSSQYKCSGDNIDLNSVNCVILNEKLKNVLHEFKSARSIIALLQEDMNNIRESDLPGSQPLFNVVHGYNVNLLENGSLLSIIITGDHKTLCSI